MVFLYSRPAHLPLRGWVPGRSRVGSCFEDAAEVAPNLDQAAVSWPTARRSSFLEATRILPQRPIGTRFVLAK